MADETTQQDSTNSEATDATTDGASSEATTEQQDATNAEAGDTGAADTSSEEETSVLGGDVKESATDDGAAGEGEDDTPAGPPEKYELALEGIELDKDALEAAEPVFRELNLSNEQANKLMPVAKDFAERTAASTLQQVVEAGAAQRKEWLDAFKADEQIGGANEEETTHLAGKALDALGYTTTGHGEDGKAPHPFRKVLTETGFGNHPEMIRVFRRIGEIVDEGGFVRADAGAKVDQPTEQRWYRKKEG